MLLCSCNKPVPSVEAAPSPAPLPTLDRFIPAKGAKGGGKGRNSCRRQAGGGGDGCSEMKASTADVRGVAVGGRFSLLVCARFASLPTTFHARPGCG